jgi:toxin ParE1/3/4
VTYRLSPIADTELSEAVEFYALNVSPAVARNFLTTFEEKARLLVEFPHIGTPTTKGRRLFLIGRYPYSILYRPDGGEIYISAIAGHFRRPKYWERRKP